MRRDLAAVAGLALAGLLLVLFAAPDWLRAPFLITLALFLPGYAVAAHFFPPGSVSTGERGVYAVVFSIAIVAVTGVILQLVLRLDRDVWAVALAATTILAACIKPPPRPHEPLRLALPRVYLVAIGLLAAAVVISALAIISASNGVSKANSKIHFADLWMLSTGSHAEGTVRMKVGVQSHWSQSVAYRLQLLRGERTVASSRLLLQSGKTWERTFAVATSLSGVRLKAELIRGSHIYRYVEQLVASP